MTAKMHSSLVLCRLLVIPLLGFFARVDGACNSSFVGVRSIWVPNCKGEGCNATQTTDCAWCVYNRTECDAAFGEELCTAYAAARKAQGARCLSQKEVLMEIFNATKGQAWTNNSGWGYDSEYPCNQDDTTPYSSSWYGILCSNADIVRIDLTSNNLEGTIPESMNSLVQLNALSLGGNKGLSGDIFHGLRNVSVLNPNGLILNITGVSIGGPLPQDLWSWSQLRTLLASGTGLTGTLPNSTVTAVDLTNLDLSNNTLSGPLPVQLFSLTRLTGLDIRYNRLTGNLPKEIGNLIGLTTFQLLQNHLSGPLPTELGLLQKASDMDFRFNHFTGTIPTEFANIQMLQSLYLGWNDFTGTIPSKLFQLQYLSKLDLGHNRLEGSIPSTWSPGYWSYVDLSHNKLTGPIPPAVAEFKYLQWLFLSHNKLSGTIPTWDPENLYLQALDLSSNNLHGSMPEHFPKHITFIDVHSNSMSGAINESAFTPLSRLEFLLISDNDFTGSFPHLPVSEKELKVLAHANLFSCKVSSVGPNVSSDVILGIPGSILQVPLPQWYLDKDPLASKKNLLNNPGKEFNELYAEVGVLLVLALIAGLVYRREFYRFLFSNARPDKGVDIVTKSLGAMLGLQSLLGAVLIYLYSASPQRYDCGRPLGTISATYITGDSLQYVAGIWALALPAILVGIWSIQPSAANVGLRQLQASASNRLRSNSGRSPHSVTSSRAPPSMASVDEELEDGLTGGAPAPVAEQQTTSLGARTPNRSHRDQANSMGTGAARHHDSHRLQTMSAASQRSISSWGSDRPITLDRCCKRIVMWLLWMLAVLLCAAPGVTYAFGSTIPLNYQLTKYLQWLPVIAAAMTSLVQPSLAKALGKMQARRTHTIDHTKGRLLSSAGLITWVGPMVVVIFMSENCGGYWWDFYDQCRPKSTAFDFCDSKLSQNGNVIGCAATTENVCGTRWIAIERCTMSIMDVLVPLLLSKILAAISLSLVFLLLCRLLGGETSINLTMGRRRLFHYDVLANFREAHSITNLTIFGDIGLAWAPICPLIAFAGFCYIYTLRVSNAVTKNAFGLDPTRWSQASPVFSRFYLLSGVCVSCALMVCHVASAGDDRPAKTAAICLGAVVIATGMVFVIWQLQKRFCAKSGSDGPAEVDTPSRRIDSMTTQRGEAGNLPLLTENTTSISSERSEQEKPSSLRRAELAEHTA